MPCNLAVSITKAAVTEDHLRALLTADVTSDVVLRFLEQQYPHLSPRLISASGSRMVFWLDSGDITLTITNGQTTVDATRAQQRQANAILAQVSQLLARLADQRFQRQVQTALSARFGARLTSAQVIDVDNEGECQQAAVFTLTLS